MEYSEIKEVIEFCSGLHSEPDVREVLEEAQYDEFWVDNVHFISEDVIEQVWEDSLIEQIKACFDLSDVPSFVEIDWVGTADNCKVDGMGHHFNSYDGGEDKVTIDGTLYYVFDNH